jgi:hypothetical protein
MNRFTPPPNLVNGLVPAGESCFASNVCELKYCGEACPVCDGKTQAVDFSCGFARALKIAYRPPKGSKETTRSID